jgi:hypothetical protein
MSYGGLPYGGEVFGGDGLLTQPIPPGPPPPPVFGPPGRVERVQVMSLHGQPGNQLQRTSPNTLHKQVQ